jgi:CubicO group peptidase (beta-lactamase class C family)
VRSSFATRALSLAIAALLLDDAALTAPAAAQTSQPGGVTAGRSDPEACDRVRSLLDSLRVAHPIPGAQAAVYSDGELACSVTSGMADVVAGRPVTDRTLFRIGSISKALTADAAATLTADGLLDLDAPVRRYVTDFPAKRWEPAVRHLATHTAGIRHYTFADGFLPNARRYESLGEGLERFAADSLLFEPGTRYHYSSYGYVLLGAVLEAAGGAPYESLVRERVLDPIGLTRTVLEGPDTLPDRTVDYERFRGSPQVALYDDNSYKGPAGGWLSTAEELARFGAAHVGKGAIPDAVRAILFAPASLNSGEPVLYDDDGTRVGLGWRIGRDDEGRAIVHHGGATRGGRAILVVWPDDDVAVAITANLMAPIDHDAVHRMAAPWLDR